jgi:hypothetical protein
VCTIQLQPLPFFKQNKQQQQKKTKPADKMNKVKQLVEDSSLGRVFCHQINTVLSYVTEEKTMCSREPFCF